MLCVSVSSCVYMLYINKHIVRPSLLLLLAKSATKEPPSFPDGTYGDKEGDKLIYYVYHVAK